MRRYHFANHPLQQLAMGDSTSLDQPSQPKPGSELSAQLQRLNDELYMEDVALAEVAAATGTPTFVYSQTHLHTQYQRLCNALDGLDFQICYAVKANSNLSVLQLFAHWGAGFDIVSAGELQRVISAGADPAKVVFSGVGKSVSEIDFALKHQIGCFNVESASELNRLQARASLLGLRAPISIRMNPNVDAGTHPYISTGLRDNKFGVPKAQALRLYAAAAQMDAVDIKGIDCHIGSQIAEVGPLNEALASLLETIDELGDQGITLEHVDVGGGMGVTYSDETEFNIEAYGASLKQALGHRKLQLMMEPGRFLVANGGVLLTTVEYLKPTPGGDTDGSKNFAVVDAAMNDLLRPALYQAWHSIEPVGAAPDAPTKTWEIVGPICESGDFLGAQRILAIAEGDLLAIHSAGAYGMAQASNYNSRSRAAEVLVSGDTYRTIRQRETIRDQLALELDGLSSLIE